MTLPKLTIGIVSCNRLHYLKCLIESAKICVTYKNIQWIIVDNGSVEIGLIEYINKQNFFDHKILIKNRKPDEEHINALNLIYEKAVGDFILILSDDVQFVRKDWEVHCLNLLKENNDISTISLSALRRPTIKNIYNFNISHLKPILRDILLRNKLRLFKKYQIGNEQFSSFGYMRESIDGVGMLTVSKKEIWKNLVPWTTKPVGNLTDSSGGGETLMLQKAIKYKINGHMVTPNVPVIATIFNDPEGVNARIRKYKRYGNYTPPQGKFYYKFIDNQISNSELLNFEKVIQPIDFKLNFDKHGNLIKKTLNKKLVTNL